MLKESLRKIRTYGLTTAIALAVTATPADAIVGGSETQRPESWMVSLQGANGHYCGGVLIAPDWVLTAGHCVVDLPGKPLMTPEKIVIGGLSKSQGGTIVHASGVFPHPTAKLEQDPNGVFLFSGTDLALIKLDRPVPHAPAPMSHRTPPVGTPARLLGWGYAGHDANGQPVFPDKLREITLPIADTGEDRLRFKDPAGRGGGAGDSGGPAVVKSGHGWKLVGITSSGGTDAEGVAHSNYTDVSVYQSWIHRTIAQHLLS